MNIPAEVIYTCFSVLAAALVAVWKLLDKKHTDAVTECREDRTVLRTKLEEHTTEIAELRGKLGAASAPCGLPDCPKRQIGTGKH